jgi:tetratricopeptide (TPR) repeat protein
LEERLLKELQQELSRRGFAKALRLIERLRDDDTRKATSTAPWRTAGLVRYFMGDFQGAIAEYEMALDRNSNSVGALNDLAYVLACCPDEAFRDAKRAVDLAFRSCVQSEWKLSGPLKTLAAAYALAGEFELAKAYAEKVDAQSAEELERKEELMRCILQSRPFIADIEIDYERWRGQFVSIQ